MKSVRNVVSSLLLSGTVALALACGGGLQEPPTVPSTAVPATWGVVFPLAVGQSWRYKVERHSKAGMRFMFFATRDAGSKHIEDWHLNVNSVDDSASPLKYQATLVRKAPGGEELESTAMTLWTDADGVWFDTGSGRALAIEMALPERVITSNRLACTAHFLGGAVGECSALPGGMNKAAVGVLGGVVSRHTDTQARSAQPIIALMTAGLFIPGDTSTSTIIKLVKFKDPGRAGPVEPALWGAYLKAEERTRGRFDMIEGMIREHGADAESIGLILGRVHADNVSRVTLGTLPFLAEDQRVPVLRTGLSLLERYQPHLLARALPLIGVLTPQEQEVLLENGLQNGFDAKALLSGESPALAAYYAAAPAKFDPKEDEKQGLKALRDHPYDQATATVMCRLFSKGGKGPEFLAAVVEKAPVKAGGRHVIQFLERAGRQYRQAMIDPHQKQLAALSDEEKRALLNEFGDKFVRRDVQKLLGL